MARATVAVHFTGNTRDLQRSLRGLDTEMSKSRKRMDSFRNGLVAAFATGAIVHFGNEMLSLAGQLESWQRKVDTVFEDSADVIREWADSNNEIFGVTDDELAGLAASFGDLLKPMGFTADQAATMAMEVVGLSGALSEWTGGQRSAADVANILSKAMLGERESLKELGISITEAEVQQRLLEKGQKDLTGAALAQAKALATQELIMEKSTDAQKAFAEGGNRALRAQNELKAKLDELKEQIAGRLIPVMLDITDWVGERFPRGLERLKRGIDRIRANWDAAWNFMANLIRTVADVVDGVRDRVIAAFELIIGVVETVRSALAAAIGAMIAVFEALRTAAHNMANSIKAALNSILGPINSVLNGLSRIRGAIGGAIGGIGSLVGSLPGFAGGVQNFRGGLAVVGERGPEIVNLPRGSDVIPNHRIGQGAPQQTINVTVNMPAGSNGDDVVRALRQWQRRNGPVPLTVA